MDIWLPGGVMYTRNAKPTAKAPSASENAITRLNVNQSVSIGDVHVTHNKYGKYFAALCFCVKGVQCLGGNFIENV